MASKNRSDGEGSLYPRHVSGCPKPVDSKGNPACKCPWQASLVVGWSDGKPIRKKVSATSRAGVATKLRELREKIDAGDLPRGRVPNTSEWMTYWLEQIAAKKVRPSTLRGYRTYVDCYINPILGGRRLDKLTPEHIAAAWAQLQTFGRPDEKGRPVDGAKPLTSTSAHQAHRILARALKVAHQRGRVTQNVATLIDPPQPADVEMEPLTKDDARKVLDAARGRRNAARWSVALALGLRQGEALGLRWEYVDLEAGTIAVRQALGRVDGQLVLGPVKSRAGRRTLKMPASLLAEMKAHRKAQAAEKLATGSFYDDRGFVFAKEDGSPTSPTTDWNQWKALLAAAGLPDRRLHDARHTAATLMLAQDVSPRTVMEILGHSRITVTSKYQHVLDEMHDDAAEKIETLWG